MDAVELRGAPVTATMGSSTEIAPSLSPHKSKVDEYLGWEEEMKAAFDEVDEDHSGDIEPKELMHLMQKVRAPLSPNDAPLRRGAKIAHRFSPQSCVPARSTTSS